MAAMDHVARALEALSKNDVDNGLKHAEAAVKESMREARVSFRAPEHVVTAIDNYGRAHGLSRSAVIRQLAKAITPEGDAGLVREIARVLGLDASASVDDVRAACGELFARIGDGGAPDDSGMGDAPDAPPAELSRVERLAADKIKDPQQRAAFVALRKQRAIELARKKKGNRK